MVAGLLVDPSSVSGRFDATSATIYFRYPNFLIMLQLHDFLGDMPCRLDTVDVLLSSSELCYWCPVHGCCGKRVEAGMFHSNFINCEATAAQFTKLTENSWLEEKN